MFTFYLFSETIPVANVSGLLGRNARLPCDTTEPSPDNPLLLVIWFKEPSPDPIYRYVLWINPSVKPEIAAMTFQECSSPDLGLCDQNKQVDLRGTAESGGKHYIVIPTAFHKKKSWPIFVLSKKGGGDMSCW